MKRAPLSLKAQALALLARREHSRAELRTKLLAHARQRAAVDAEAARTRQARERHGNSAWEGQPFGDDPPSDPNPDSLVPAQAEDATAQAAAVDAVLDWLQAQRHQSDARFIESRLNSRAPRQGLARIRQEMARHGVTLDADTVQALRQTEVQRAREVWHKRFGRPPADATERARQMRFLAARGFSGDAVRKVLGGDTDDLP